MKYLNNAAEAVNTLKAKGLLKVGNNLEMTIPTSYEEHVAFFKDVQTDEALAYKLQMENEALART